MNRSSLILFCLLVSLGCLNPAWAQDSSVVNLNNLGRDAYKRGNYLKAEQLLNRALKKGEQVDKDSLEVATVLDNLGQVYLDQKKFSLCQPLLERALKIRESKLSSDSSTLAISLNTLADLYSRQKKYDKARQLYKRAMSINKKALGPDSRAVATNLNNLALSYILEGDYEPAKPLLMRSIAILEKKPESNKDLIAAHKNSLANLYWRQGKLSEALPLIESALAMGKEVHGANHPTVAIFRTNCQRLKEQIRTKQGGQTTVKTEEPASASSNDKSGDDDASVEYIKILTLMKADRVKEASELIESRIARDPSDARAYYFKGLLLHQTGKYEDASKQFNKAIALAPDQPQFYQGLVLVYLGKGEKGKALATLREIVRKFPESRAAEKAKPFIAELKNTGTAGRRASKDVDLLKKNKLSEAKEVLEKMLEKNPSDARALCNYGLVLAKLGKPEQGLVQLQKSIKLAPDRPEPVFGVALICVQQGRTREAVKRFKEFVRRFPSNPQARLAKASIAHLEKEVEKLDRLSSIDAPHYLDHATDQEGILKWRPADFPLSVYIEPAVNISGYKDSYGKLLRKAFGEWTSGTNGKLTFRFVDTKDNARISCRFVDDVKLLVNPIEGGDALVHPGDDGIKEAQITLLANNPRITQGGDEKAMHSICLHEIGHALGLIGHSPNAKDVMYHSQMAGSDKRLSERDCATMSKLYSSAIKYSGNWKVLYNRAAKFLNAGNYGEAIPILEKIKDTNREAVDEALAIAYMKEAEHFIHARQIDPAEAALQKVLALNPKERVKKAAKEALDMLAGIRKKMEQ